MNGDDVKTDVSKMMMQKGCLKIDDLKKTDDSKRMFQKKKRKFQTMLKMWNDSLNLNKRTKRRPIGSPAITLILFGIGQPAHPKLLVVVKNKNIQTRVRTGLFFSNHSNNVRQCASI